MGVSLFVHSVRLVLGDWRNALKITGLLYLIYAVPALVFALLFPTPVQPEQAMAALGSGGFLGLITAILAIVAFVWVAVAWHRYVLLDEVPAGQFPEFNSSRLLSYGGYSLLIGLIGFVLSFIVSAVVGIIAIPLLNVVGVFITGLLALAAVLIVGYRLAPILPSIAIGKPITLRQAWEATNSANVPIIVLAVLSAVAALVIDIPAFVFAMAGPIGGFLAVLWTLATGWVKMIVGVSILTTLYGHYIEGRAIPSAMAGANG
ncbi:MAG: hypothetical protein EOP24_07070 [Hyphomicrobiales bacterium]|nr:MAG: hypothetical protein EOP24_07070 [Hyphomicrobiales bacterium]